MFALCRRIGYDEASSEVIADIYNAVKKTNNASYMRDPATPKIGGGGFVFCEDLELEEIKRELKIRNESGTALALGLRNVQHILKNYEDFVIANFTYFENKKYGYSEQHVNKLKVETRSNTIIEKTLSDLKEDFRIQLTEDLMIN